MTEQPPAQSTENEAQRLAERFHEAYERLAPQFGYETRRESAVPWEDVPEQNKALMIAVCAEVMPAALSDTEAKLREYEEALAEIISAIDIVSNGSAYDRLKLVDGIARAALARSNDE